MIVRVKTGVASALVELLSLDLDPGGSLGSDLGLGQVARVIPRRDEDLATRPAEVERTEGVVLVGEGAGGHEPEQDVGEGDGGRQVCRDVTEGDLGAVGAGPDPEVAEGDVLAGDRDIRADVPEAEGVEDVGGQVGNDRLEDERLDLWAAGQIEAQVAQGGLLGRNKGGQEVAERG